MSEKSALIGYTGFIGTNLSEQHTFTEYYNSRNITEMSGESIDLLICAGVSGTKWLANQEPEEDIKNIEKLKAQIVKNKINRFILISTVDIYDTPLEVNENSIPNVDKQDFYGKHRYQLEQWLTYQKNITSYSIIRLPGLFGAHLKKNLIFDIINPLAKLINKNLWQNLKNKLNLAEQNFIQHYYKADGLGNLHQQADINYPDRQELIFIFSKAAFSSLNFTDSRSSMQFYNLANLWKDIQYVINNNIQLFNLSSEPIIAQELVQYVTKKEFINLISQQPVNYNMHSQYAEDGKYLYKKSEILQQIKAFIEAQTT